MPPLSRSLRSFRHRNYRLWAAADLISVTGTWMQALAANWLILTITGSATSLGIGVVLQALPALVLSMWAGALADRLPTRVLLLATQAAQALFALLLALVTVVRPDSVVPVYGLLLAGGAAAALGGPALGRFCMEVVGREDLPNALSLGSIINSSGRILGMGVAGALMPLLGAAGLFTLNAVSFLAVITALVAVRGASLHPVPKAEAESTGVVAGIRYISGIPWLLILFALAFTLSTFGRNYQVTMAAMSSGPLGAGAAGYGILSVVFAVGTVLGGIYVASRTQLTVKLLLTSALLASLGQAISGFMPGLVSFAVLILPVAVCAVVIDTTVAARIQLDSVLQMQGRVLAAKGMVAAAAGAIGGPLLGLLCDVIGARQTLVISGLITVAATVAAGVALVRARSGAPPQEPDADPDPDDPDPDDLDLEMEELELEADANRTERAAAPAS